MSQEDGVLVLAPEQQWFAVRSRSTHEDGSFVYAVRSTGVYCKPSCPSRRPKRENVVFFPEPKSAEAAGFRPCRRCEPREVLDRQQRVTLSLCAYIGAHPGEELTLQTLSKRVGMSPSHLQRAFKRIAGVSPREYVEAVRLGKFRHLLRDEGSVRSSTYQVGRSSTSWPYRGGVGSVLGMEARAYRDGGAGRRVRFATARCSLGFLLVAGTARGVCFVALGDSEEGAREELRREYPRADITEDRDSVGSWIRAVTDSLDLGDPAGLESLPLDIRATAFQWKVWKCLVSIPPGSTTSYGELARKVGSPRGARAVGSACGSNPLAIVIPCHRVVASDGALGGYRWGVARKRSILRREGAREKAVS